MLKRAEKSPCVLDAALIPYWRVESWLDAVCWVSAPFDVRCTRLVEKWGMNTDEVRMRMRLQEQLLTQPTGNRWIMIDNTGTIKELEQFLASEEFTRILSAS
jgi:dephospho-CoA kinase